MTNGNNKKQFKISKQYSRRTENSVVDRGFEAHSPDRNANRETKENGERSYITTAYAVTHA